MSSTSRRRFLQSSLVGIGATLTPSLLLSQSPRPSGPQEDRFIKAIRQGNLQAVTQLLASHPELLQARDDRQRSGFALALLNGHKSVAEYLRSQGYTPDVHELALATDWKSFEKMAAEHLDDINADHPIGGTAMYAAAAGGAGDQMWRVYAVCGDPNGRPRGPRGETPLQAALRYPDLAISEQSAAMLLTNEAEANVPGTDEQPLHLAAKRGSATIVEILIRKGAHMDAVDANGQTALQLAQQQGHEEVVKLLKAHKEIPRDHGTSRRAYDLSGTPYRPEPINDIPIVRRSRLVGASHGNLAAVQKTIERDPRMVHSVATTGEGAVEACAHTGRKNIVEYLLERGAPYSLPTAAVRGDLARVKQLIEEDPLRIHERGAHDFALLWYPVIGGCSLEMTEYLLQQGAEVERQHVLGTTALHWACLRGPIELVDLLIDHGGDVNRVARKFDYRGETPLQMAISARQQRIAALLRQRGAKS